MSKSCFLKILSAWALDVFFPVLISYQIIVTAITLYLFGFDSSNLPKEPPLYFQSLTFGMIFVWFFSLLTSIILHIHPEKINDADR